MSVCERDISRKLVRSQLSFLANRLDDVRVHQFCSPSCCPHYSQRNQGKAHWWIKIDSVPWLFHDPAFTSIRDAGYRMHLPSVSACFILGPQKESYALDVQLHSHRDHSFASKEILFRVPLLLRLLVLASVGEHRQFDQECMDFYKAYYNGNACQFRTVEFSWRLCKSVGIFNGLYAESWTIFLSWYLIGQHLYLTSK